MKSQVEISPPKLPLKFLRCFCNPDLVEDVEGDISELFTNRKKENKNKAKLLFTLDVLLLFRPGMIRNFKPTNRLINGTMIQNYLKIARRNALRYKGYTLLNLLGLVVGISSTMLILLWVNDEVSVDKFHANGDKIYQLFRNMKQSSGSVSTTISIPKPVSDLLVDEYPEVKQVAMMSWEMDFLFSRGEKVYQEQGQYATPEFLKMFSFPLVTGDRNTALDNLSSILISRSMAKKFFGSEWREKALGETLRLDDQRDVIITGIFEDPGDNSSLNFEWILPAQDFINRNEWVENWGNGAFRIYTTIDNEADARAVSERIVNEIIDHTEGNDLAGEEYLILHKFQDYYLNSNFNNGIVDGGRIDYVRIMMVVAIFILIIACINFMNLATARSGRRSKEIGLRKVMGAHKKSIGAQFFLESILLTALSVLLSVLVVLLVLPFFNQLVDKSLILDFTQLKTWYFILSVTFIVGILSGSYPALLLPTFNIINSLRGSIKQSPSATFFRKGLVVFQFAISILLIVGTAVIYKQLDYALNKDLGIDKENLVAVRMDGDLPQRLETYKTELGKIPEVKAITVASGNPIDYGRSTSSAKWEGMNTAGYEINVIISDEDFIETMGMEILAGRGFSQQLTDSTNFIINEVAAELMGFDDPLEKDLSFWGIDGKIVGVVKNFHMRDMYTPIAPLIITCIAPSNAFLALIRIEGNTGEALKSIEKITKELNPAFDFDYEFIDEAYAENYRSEQTVGVLVNIFASISIFIACLGLLGLSSYTAERRSMEIGIRKVHGASVTQILVLLSKDYSKLMVMAFVLAIPFGYYYMQQWLNNFEFRTNLDPFVFIVAGVLTFVIGVLTVSVKSYQAATVNPADSLKDE